jgi:hypothetical protein
MTEPNGREPHPDRVFQADTFTEIVTDAATRPPVVPPPPPPGVGVTESVDVLFQCDVEFEPGDAA